MPWWFHKSKFRIRGWHLVLVLCALSRTTPAASVSTESFVNRCRRFLNSYRVATTFHGHAIIPFDEWVEPSFAVHQPRAVKYFSKFRRYNFETGTVERGSQVWLNEMIDGLNSVGGQMRVLTRDGWLAKREATDESYFYVDLETGTPYLAIATNAPRHHVEHEYQHFENWRKRRDQIIAKGGVSKLEAARQAVDELRGSPMQMFEDERLAVDRELRALDPQDVKNLQNFRNARSIYPEIATIQHWLNKAKRDPGSVTASDHAQLEGLMNAAIWKVVEFRVNTIKVVREQIQKTPNDQTLHAKLRGLINVDTIKLAVNISRDEALLPMISRQMESQRSIIQQALSPSS